MRGEKDKVKNGTWSLETFILSPGSAGKHKHHYNRIKPQQFTIIGSKTQLELLPSVSTNHRGNKQENLEMELKKRGLRKMFLLAAAAHQLLEWRRLKQQTGNHRVTFTADDIISVHQ